MSNRVGSDESLPDGKGAATSHQMTQPGAHQPKARPHDTPDEVLRSHSTEPGVTGAKVPPAAPLGGES